MKLRILLIFTGGCLLLGGIIFALVFSPIDIMSWMGLVILGLPVLAFLCFYLGAGGGPLTYNREEHNIEAIKRFEELNFIRYKSIDKE